MIYAPAGRESLPEKGENMRHKEKLREAMAYLPEKKIQDLKSDLLIMKLSHLLSIKKARNGIIAGLDILFLFLFNYGTNIVKCSLQNIASITKGTTPEKSPLSLLNLIWYWNHSLIWWIAAVVIIAVITVRVHYVIYTNYRDINKNQKGSTRWSTLDEIREQYPAIPLKLQKPYETYYGKGGVPVCHYGTYYNDENELCDIDKGVIYIDPTPVNNLIIGITRSGKGEMFVFSLIDIYSRAENKIYNLYPKWEQEEITIEVYTSNIYYDYREGGRQKFDIPERLGDVKMTEKEFLQVISNYEKEYNVKLSLSELYQPKKQSSIFDFIDNSESNNIVKEQIVVSVNDKVKAKKNKDEQAEVKLLSKKICILDKKTGDHLEYAFHPEDGKSKKEALDEAFMYLDMLQSTISSKYNEYQAAMGFEVVEKAYKVNSRDNINVCDQNEQEKRITENLDKVFDSSDAYKDVKIEEYVDGEIIPDAPEKRKDDPIMLLADTLKVNHITVDPSKPSPLHFVRNYQASMVVDDPKLELFTASKPILELRGYRVYCINLINPYESSGYNPLQIITDTYKGGDPAEASAIARSLATSIFKGDVESKENAFFYDNAVFLTAALIMSEVIDEIRADEEANKVYLQMHIEATERFANLSDQEKEQVRQLGKKLEDLKNKRQIQNDKYELVMLDRGIRKLETELEKYNYNEQEFQPHTDHEKKINLPNVLMKFSMLAEKMIAPEVEGAEPRNALDLFFENRDPLDVARNLYSAIKISGGERTKGSIYSTVLSKLTGFMDDKIKKMTAVSSFHLQDIGFGDRPIAVFIAMPDYDTSNVFLQSIFISQTYFALAKNAIHYGGKCKREVIFLLDEFGNIPCIANMASMITVCLGRNIRFDLIVQAYSQLDKEYGEHDSDTIYGNCGNQIYIQTDNYKTADQFSNLIGKETIINVSRMGSEFSLVSKQYTESTEEKALLNPNELMEFVEGECVVKRVMMRKDQYSNRVKPRPIYNKGKTAFPLRYQYMSDWFNTDNRWEDLHAESCAGLELEDYISDFNQLIDDITKKNTPEYKEWYQMITDNYEKNKRYPISSFVQKESIILKLIVQVEELREMERKKIEQLSLADIEKYFIRYESNIPAFRRRMYEITDWSRTDEKKLGEYKPGLLKFAKIIFGEKADAVWKEYELDDDEHIQNMTTTDLLRIMQREDVTEAAQKKFKVAMEKYEIKEEL